MTLRKHLSGNYWKQKGLSSVMKKKNEILKWMREEFHLEELINNLADIEKIRG